MTDSPPTPIKKADSEDSPKMKIYVKQLVALATSKAPPDRVGWLLKRGEVNKSFQKRYLFQLIRCLTSARSFQGRPQGQTFHLWIHGMDLTY